MRFRSSHALLTRRAVLRTAGAMVGAGIGSAPTVHNARVQSSQRTFITAADFYPVGDGVTDDAIALQTAVGVAAARKLPLVIPPGSYAVSRSLVIPSGISISAYGATLVTLIPELGDPGTSFPTVRISDVADVVIHGLEIDGRKDAFAHSQWKHGFALNNARNVWLYQCRANRCKGDGVILEDKNVGDVCVDVLVESCSFGQNYRMGGTASGALRARFVNCVFWGTRGTHPMCGFDVEPDRGDVICQDISFFHCEFSDNGIRDSGVGSGFNVSFYPDATGPQAGVSLENCILARNGGAGVDLFRVPKDIAMVNCQVLENVQGGIRVFADATDITIRGGNVTANGRHGIQCAVASDAPCRHLVIDAVKIVDNGWVGTTPANGIHLDHVVRDVRVTGCTVTGSRGFGVLAGPAVTDLELSDTVFAGNLRGPTFPVELADSSE